MLSEAEMEHEIEQWLIGLQPAAEGQHLTFADQLAHWRRQGGEQWQRKYLTDPAFHTVLDTAERYCAQAEEHRARLFAALTELWRIHRDVGRLDPAYPETMRPAMEAAFRALYDTARPGDPPVAH